MNTRIQLPGYEIYEKVYESSHTIIYRGRRLKDNRLVILKVAPESGETGANHRLRREFDLGVRVNSKYVVCYLTLESMEERLVIVQEDAGGMGLRDQIPKAGFRKDVFLGIAASLAKGVMAIHAANIIHGDIKPGNIVFDPTTLEVKILDFGASAVWEGEGRQCTGKMEGTLAYMSPEQTGRMNQAVDYRTDFYSLGVTFYEMLTGAPPFKARDPLEYVHCHIARTPKAPHFLTGETPVILSDMVMKLMAKNPEERYQSAIGLCRDLERIALLDDPNGYFELGTQDTHDRFHIPDKVFGRQYEKRLMLEAFERAGEGRPEVLLIMGEAGVGKTVLVHELPKVLSPGNGFFISGRFELMSSGAAYSAVTRAFRDLARRLLGESEEKIAAWRMKLAAALGENGQIIVDVIPEVGVILGKQKQVEELPPQETQNRFHTVFQRFVGVFASVNNPLIIFLDDLQWADQASLNLIDRMLERGNINHLLLICAFRANEVDAALKQKLDSLKGRGVGYSELVLTPIKNQDVVNLLAEMLHARKKDLRALSRLAMQKTEGNPFFIHEWLKTLYRENIIVFDPEKATWAWDIERATNIKARDNVVQLLEKRFCDLPDETRDILRVGSCMGVGFDCRTLAKVLDKPLDEILIRLEPALHNGVLSPVGAQSATTDDGSFQKSDYAKLRFQHDKIHGQAYKLNNSQSRIKTHLKLGRAMLSHLSQGISRENLPVIVSHFNEAESLVKDPRERRILARLNLKLARRARSSADYSSALNYLMKSVDLLPDNAWETMHNLTFLIHVTFAETTYLMGDYEKGEAISHNIFFQARTDLEKASVIKMRVTRLAAFGKWDQLIQMGLEGINLLGGCLQAKPGKFLLWKEGLALKRILRNKSLDQLQALPLARKQESKVLMRLLMIMTAPAHLMGNRQLYKLICLNRIRLSLKNGVQPECISAFITYGSLYGIVANNFKVAETFGQLSLGLLERLGSHELDTRIRVLHAILLQGWTNHWNTVPPILENAIETGLNNGDYMFTAFACAYANHWNPTMDLPTSIKRDDPHLAILAKTRHESIILLGQIIRQYRRNLMGLTRGSDTLDDDDFNEQLAAGKLAASASMSELAVYHLIKLQLHFTYENYEQAEQHLNSLGSLEVHLDSMLHMVDYRLYAFLTTIMTWSGRRIDQKQKLLRLRNEYRHVKKWAEHCPENFEHLQFLMKAEWSRIRGKVLEAGNYYEKAIETAQANCYPRYQTLAAELAAKFYQSIGQSRVANLFFRDARDLYKKWGASAKVHHLEDRHILHFSGEIFETLAVQGPANESSEIKKDTRHASISDGSSRTDSGNVLDMATVTKASQAISSEMDMDRLVVKILTIILENAGAQNGFLIMDEDRRLFVKAAAHMEEEAQAVSKTLSLDKADFLSKTIVRYVFRTGQNLVLNNALEDEMFGKTPYIRDKGVKSILCTPIYRQDHVLGVLYLENNLIANAFIKERLKLLQVLLSQAAISLENARLYSSSHSLNQALLKEVEDRKGAEAKVRSLNEALEERVEERTLQLKAAQRELIEKAHQAGMAEIATSVLHNVGNILNSVITSSQMIQRTVENSRLNTLTPAGKLLEQNRNRIGEFLSLDPKGISLVDYYMKLSAFHEKEQTTISENVTRLISKINAIRDVIMYQQSHATMGFQPEKISLHEVVEDSLLILGNSLSRHEILVEKKFSDVPEVFAQKVKLLHIIINIIKNAKEAIDQGAVRDRRVTISFRQEEKRVAVMFQDTGVGIARENLKKIFSHGFTTKPENHGFGLHGCANSLTEMGGSISAFSDGLGKGATFVLFLPIASQEQKEPAVTV